MPPGQVEPRKQPGADRAPPCLQALGTTAPRGDALLETALGLLFDHLPLDQSGMGLFQRGLGASWLARAGQGRERLGDLAQRRTVTTAASAHKARATHDHSRRQRHERPRPGKGPWAHKRRQEEPALRGKAAPDPRPPVLTQRGAGAVRPGLRGMLTRDAVPHRIKWPLGDGHSRSRWALSSSACGAARRSHARTVASVTPRTQPKAESATLTRSIGSAMMLCSCGVFRSTKTGARDAEKGR